MLARIALARAVARRAVVVAPSLVARTVAPSTPSLVLRAPQLARLFSSSLPQFQFASDLEINPPSKGLFIANVPWEASEGELAAFLEPLQGFVELKTAIDSSGRNRGFAKAFFETIEDATRARETLASDPPEILGRTLRFDFAKEISERPRSAPSSTLFVGNLPNNVTETDLKAAYGPFAGCGSINIKSNSFNKPAYAWVEFDSTANATAALEGTNERPLWQNGPIVRVDFHTASSPKRDRAPTPPSTTVFVGGVDSEEKAIHLFQNNPYESFRIINDPLTGQPRGFGYAEFSNVEEAREAISALNGKQIPGQERGVRLDFAPPRREERRDGARRDGGRRDSWQDRGSRDGGRRNSSWQDRGSREGGRREDSRGGYGGGSGGYGGGSRRY